MCCAALTLAACSTGGGASSQGPTTTTTTLPFANTRHPTLVRVDNYPNPEGPVGHFTASADPRAFAALVRALPEVLPPSSVNQECGVGGTVVFRRTDGSSRHYGPCTKPVAIQRALNVFYDAVGPVPKARSVVVPDVVGKLVPGAWVALAVRHLAPDVPRSVPMTSRIIEQQPAAGSRVRFNTVVSLVACPLSPTTTPDSAPTCVVRVKGLHLGLLPYEGP